MRLLTLFFLLLLPSADGWAVFARVKFKSTFFKEINEYFLVPTFSTELNTLAGKELTLKGHYIPFDLPANTNTIILSKNPFTSCFFCGGAGPESVAEINFKNKTKTKGRSSDRSERHSSIEWQKYQSHEFYYR